MSDPTTVVRVVSGVGGVRTLERFRGKGTPVLVLLLFEVDSGNPKGYIRGRTPSTRETWGKVETEGLYRGLEDGRT